MSSSSISKTSQVVDIFGVPVGLINEDKKIDKEKYVPKAKGFNTEAWALGSAGTAAGTGALAGLSGGSKGAAGAAVAVGVVSLAVGGAMMGVSHLFQAFNHQRVSYITIRNTSDRSFVFLSGYNKSGTTTVPEYIPPNSVVRIAFHNEGPFSGAIRFNSKEDFLYIASSNPTIGKNKLRVECTQFEHDLYKYWDDMYSYDTRNDCGRNVFLSGCVYDNPSQCTIDIKPNFEPNLNGSF